MRSEKPTTAGEAFSGLLFLCFVFYMIYVAHHFIDKYW